ncbi:MAG: TRAP transporter small permease subunit, partial [Cephaloticoccus sp.]|nr:TRAP transporter small permease subunit [Cephaloticoccus sp.]
RRLLEIVIEVIVLVFAVAILVVGGGRVVWITLQLGQTSAALEIKLGYVYLAVPISGLIIAFYGLMALIDTLRGKVPATTKEVAS